MLKAIALLQAAQAKEEAMRLDRAGQHAQSSQVLRAMAASLPALLAAAPDAEVAAGLDETTRKEAHYQSYLRQHSRRRYDL